MICFRNTKFKRQFFVCYRRKWFRVNIGGLFGGVFIKHIEGVKRSEKCVPISFDYKKLKAIIGRYINIYGI